MHMHGFLHISLVLPFQRCIDLGSPSSFSREETFGNRGFSRICVRSLFTPQFDLVPVR